jgi:hypothetical protein
VAYQVPSGRMGEPPQGEPYVRLQAEDLELYLAPDFWNGRDQRTGRILVAIPGYGRFWITSPGGEQKS